MSNVIYTIAGLTGSGKTTVGELLQARYGIKHVHPIRPLKAHYEELLGLPDGWLETREGKDYVPPGSNYTMQDIMVAEYHMKMKYLPNYSALSLANLLPQYLQSGSVGLVSIRTNDEVEVVKQLQLKGHRHVHAPLYRYEAKAATSDASFNVLNSKLINNADAVFGINNNGTLRELESQVDKLVQTYHRQ